MSPWLELFYQRLARHKALLSGNPCSGFAHILILHFDLIRFPDARMGERDYTPIDEAIRDAGWRQLTESVYAMFFSNSLSPQNHARYAWNELSRRFAGHPYGPLLISGDAFYLHCPSRNNLNTEAMGVIGEVLQLGPNGQPVRRTLTPV